MTERERFAIRCKSHYICYMSCNEQYPRHDTQSWVGAGPPAGSNSTTRQAGKRIPTFQQWAPQAFKALRKEYCGYTKHIGKIENGTEPQIRTTTFTGVDLTYSTSGLPQVPGAIRNINGIETHVTQQQIIRTYLTAHYGRWHRMYLTVNFSDDE